MGPAVAETTAKFKVNWINGSEEQSEVVMLVDYADERNKEWARWTPVGQISLHVKNELLDNFPVGRPFLVTFTPEDN